MNRFRSLPRVVQIGVVIAAILAACCCSAAGLSVLFPGSDATPTQAAMEASPTQDASPLVSPTESQESPTDTPQPTETPQPTSTTLPTATQIPTDTPVPTPERTEAQVVRIIDGDTIEVSIDGASYKLRYIGIDTPEVDEPMGSQATAANEQLVSGKTVYLEKDVSETDRYDRLLRYVYLADSTFVNAELVRQGWAVAKAYPPDTKHQALFAQMEEEARAAGNGLWRPTPTPDTVVQPTMTPDGTAAAEVIIIAVDKREEYVDIQNVGGLTQDLTGWILVSEKGNQACPLAGSLQPGQTLRIWAMAEDSGKGGFNCGFGTNIWNNSESDPAVLYDDQGNEVDRR